MCGLVLKSQACARKPSNLKELLILPRTAVKQSQNDARSLTTATTLKETRHQMLLWVYVHVYNSDHDCI